MELEASILPTPDAASQYDTAALKNLEANLQIRA
jgi:hypothetical protein